MHSSGQCTIGLYVIRSRIKTNTRRQNVTFRGFGDGAGVDGLADGEMGEACDGKGQEEAEMHLDSNDILTVMNDFVRGTI